MLEFPAIQELIQEAVAKSRQKTILRILQVRFKSVPAEVAPAVQAIHDEAKLDKLVKLAAICPTLEAFRLGIPT